MIELTKVLDDVGNTASITEKKKLIEGLSPESKFLLMMANSPYITYGIKEKMMPNIFSHINKHHDDDDEFLGPFLELLDKLAKRELSGNEAVGEIGRVLCRYSRETSITFEKIILKDLRCNLGKRVINKVFPGLIPEFKCMLADKMSDKFNWNSGPWMVEYKYDGMRILAKVDTNGVTYYSRNGMEQENFEGLFDEDLYDIAQQFVNKRAVEDGGSFPIWFDGEVMASTYQKTMEANSSKGEKKELIFVTFDMLTHIEWASQTTKRNQKERRVDLEKAYDSSTSGNCLSTNFSKVI